MLFDLDTAPHEFSDLGQDPAFEAERARMNAHVLDWALGGRTRVTHFFSDAENAQPASASGIFVGFWDAADQHGAKANNTD